jgi:periplasmic protein TonB
MRGGIMRSFFFWTRAVGLRYKGELLSVAAHLVLLLCLVGGMSRSPRVISYRLPGTAMGDTLLTYYRPGSFKPVASKSPVKSPEKTKSESTRQPVPSVRQRDASQTAEAKAGVGTTTESGLGEGDIKIALQSYFPFPRPDLSGLPHGTKGDVILNAVIDEHGNITELTLLKGLGSPVDESVIATVQRWHYTPAMKNGVPVASEQELHFHYERG